MSVHFNGRAIFNGHDIKNGRDGDTYFNGLTLSTASTVIDDTTESGVKIKAWLVADKFWLVADKIWATV